MVAVGIALVVGVGLAFAVLVALHEVDSPSVCPKCGGDMVEWTDVYERRFTGRPERFVWRGCPKVRDHGAGSPASDDWTGHYARVLRRTFEDSVK